MKDKVIITNLRARGILGIHDWERVTPREIVINATMFTDTWPAYKELVSKSAVSPFRDKPYTRIAW